MTQTTNNPQVILKQRDYQVEKILRLRKEMSSEIVPRYQGRVLKGKRYNAFLDDIAKFLSKRIKPQALRDSVRSLVGSRVTAEVIDQTCWRLAGNERTLATTKAVPPWQKQSYAEWVPAQINSAVLRRAGRRGMELGYQLTFRILAGSPCPLEISQWWSRKKCIYMAHYRDDDKNSFGFSRMRFRGNQIPLYPFLDGRQLVTLRCLLLIEPELCFDEPGFKTIAFSPAMTAWNREQLRHRARLEPPYLCPQGYRREFPCYRCPLGLEHCRAAVHLRTYVKKPCPQCEKQEAYFDPTDTVSRVCVSCAERDVMVSEDER